MASCCVSCAIEMVWCVFDSAFGQQWIGGPCLEDVRPTLVFLFMRMGDETQ